MQFIRNRTVSTFAAMAASMMSVTVLLGWLSDVPQMRAFIPGLPQMVPATAIMMFLIASSLLLLSLSAERPESFKSRLANIICIIAAIGGAYSVSLHFFDTSPDIVFGLFRQKVLVSDGIMYGGRMSLQTSITSILLSLALMMSRVRDLKKAFYLFEGLLIGASSLCLIAIVAYIHDPVMTGPVKFIGMSLPSTVGFFLISIGTVFLKIDHGIIKNLRARDGSGLFLRLYLPFCILFPLFSSAFIHWGEEAGYYPVVFSKTMFVVVIIFSLVILGIFMASQVKTLDEARLAVEQTEARRALEQSAQSLQRTQESLEMALEASSMGTWETDLITNELAFSETAKSLTQLNQTHLTSAAFFSHVHPEDQVAAQTAREDCINKGADLNIDFRYVYDDGSFRWFRTQGRAKYDRFGRAVKLNGTIVDITAEKNHQKQLEEALREAESASSLKSTFLANMSHEIRTPLGAILGFADELNDPKLSQEDRSRYVQIIRRNGETLSHILNDILDLSKVESGHLNIEKIRFSLKSLVNEVVSLLEVRAKDKELYLDVDFGSEVGEFISSDPVRLKQILVNLVGNALKFTSVGGVRIKVSKQDSKVHFEITDTGVGIDTEKQKNLFKAFSQADSSITRLFGGTGLGLVLSQKLAVLLGGNIQLTKSALNQGSTFTVMVEDFKIADARPADRPLPKTVEAGKPLKDVSLLLTEDSPDIQKLLTLILKKEGAEVDLAVNGADCLQKYQQKPYDVILMDIQMPIMDGYTAARKLREQGFTRPIIALTAHAMSDEHQRCIQAGCDAYLSKPIQKQKLVDLILEMCAQV